METLGLGGVEGLIRTDGKRGGIKKLKRKKVTGFLRETRSRVCVCVLTTV